MIELDDYQKEAIQSTEERGGKIILAFRPGLGKTFTALSYLKKYSPQRTLVACPKSKIPEWKEDIKEFFPNTKIYTLKAGIYPDLPNGFYLTTYQSAYRIQTNSRFDSFIFDESHLVKNPQTQVFKGLYELVKQHKPDNVLLLTGTPVLNNPYELWPQLKLVTYDSFVFRGFQGWVDLFCKRRWDKKYQQWVYYGAKNLDLLQMLIRPFIVVVTSEDVKDVVKLPPLNIHKWPVKNTSKYINNQKEIGLSKIPSCIELVQKIFKKYPNEQLVIFTWHLEVAKKLKLLLNYKSISAECILGNMNIKQRTVILEKFKTGQVKVLICNTKAAGVGINIQNARFGIMLELVWSPEVAYQAIKRLHRRGAERPVHIVIMYFENSRDEKVLDAWKKKSSIISQTINLPNSETITWLRDQNQEKSLYQSNKRPNNKMPKKSPHYTLNNKSLHQADEKLTKSVTTKKSKSCTSKILTFGNKIIQRILHRFIK